MFRDPTRGTEYEVYPGHVNTFTLETEHPYLILTFCAFSSHHDCCYIYKQTVMTNQFYVEKLIEYYRRPLVINISTWKKLSEIIAQRTTRYI